jgi:hypothetical protein
MPRGKTNAIEQLINTKYSNGAQVTVAELATEVGCTVQNVYIYMRKNSSRFSQISRGVYKINPSDTIVAINNNSSSMTLDTSTEV